MGIKIDLEKKLIVNGKEYSSWAEVPEEIRRLGGTALRPDLLPPSGISGKRSIVFNGKEYADLSAMPEEERKTFEMIMQTLKMDGGGPGLAGSGRARDAVTENQGALNVTLSLDSYRKNKPVSAAFSSNWLPKIIAALGLLGVLYYLLK